MSVLRKIKVDDDDGGSVSYDIGTTFGNINGDIASQADLKAELDKKGLVNVSSITGWNQFYPMGIRNSNVTVNLPSLPASIVESLEVHFTFLTETGNISLTINAPTGCSLCDGENVGSSMVYESLEAQTLYEVSIAYQLDYTGVPHLGILMQKFVTERA